MQQETNIQFQPMSSLVRSKLNVRKKQGACVEELAALISSQGLLQNLIGVAQVKRRKPTGIVEIVAGGRRLEALALLLARGQITADFLVPCKLVSEEEAVSISLAENSGREPMHPADEFEAMRALVAGGKSIEDIAAAFGLTPLTVKRRLRLAHVSPRLFSLYREDKIRLDQLMALALTDDHAAQEQAWDSLPEWNRHAGCIRKLLVRQEVSVKADPLAWYVGVNAYEKAGGIVRRDLFDEDAQAGYMQDALLLEQLAQAALEKVAVMVREEGWAWVEINSRCNYEQRMKYTMARTIRRTPTPEEQAALAAIEEEQEKLDILYATSEEQEDTDDDALQNQADDLEARRDAIELALTVYDLEEKAIAGAMVTINGEGEVEILRGLIRQEDRKAVATIANGKEDRAAESPHSERLIRQLTAQRTAALQAALMDRPDVALVALAARLAETVLSPLRYCMHAVNISLRMPHLKAHAANIEDSRAWKALQARREEWQTRISSTDEQTFFEWLLDQPQAVVLDLLAFCTACSLDTVQSQECATPEFNVLAKAVYLDMRDWWSVGKETYLDHVTKSRILELVAGTVSEQAAQPLAAMKKDALIEAAQRSLSVAGWLPDVLKTA
jgi:ParB family chromosome partitioning protein